MDCINQINRDWVKIKMIINIDYDLKGSILDIGGGGEAIIGQMYGDKVTAIDNRQEELDEAPNCCTKLLMDDEFRDIYICDVIVLAQYRNRGYGTDALQQLCIAAKNNGIAVLHDDIAADNPSYKLFLKNGFEIEYQNEEIVMVKRNL